MIFVRLAAALAALFLVTLPSAAHADDWFDCKYGIDEKVLPDDGISGCTKIIRQNKESSKAIGTAYGYRCTHKLNKKNFDDALRDCERGVELNRSSFTLIARGNAYSAKKLQDLAFADYTSAIGLDNNTRNDAVAYSNRASISAERGDDTAALSDHNRAVSLAPRDARMYRDRAGMFIKLKQYDKALADTDSAIALKLKDEMTYFRRALALYSQRNYSAAMRSVTLAIETYQNETNAYGLRALMYERDNKLDLALSDIESNILNHPEHGQSYVVRGGIFVTKGDFAAADADFAKAMKYGVKGATILNQRAWALFKAGKAAQGLPYAEQALKLEQQDGNIWDTRAHIYEVLGRKQEALSDFRKAVELNPTSAVSKEGLARLSK